MSKSGYWTCLTSFFLATVPTTIDYINTPVLAAAMSACSFEARGTTVPNTSGSPAIINHDTGTIISANFFNSGAIDQSFFDGNEFVSVCILEGTAGGTLATISYDVGRDDDATIKGYPEFIVGTKFGNLFETSFGFYSNTGLSESDRWPVSATNLSNDGTQFEFANLQYVSKTRSVGLPAFVTELPNIEVLLDLDEVNVHGSERDVMLESWFHDTSRNAALIGNDGATGKPIANTLNNIVGVGHKHYSELDNTILEMMVHIGPLSPNDVSQATRNPGQQQLTERFSGKDSDLDGIDDHFDVDSHINAGTSLEPNPGIYSSGVDANLDGIDDADLLPVKIGDYLYALWYGDSFLAPIIIFSRESMKRPAEDNNYTSSGTNLTAEGPITLNWNEFIRFTIDELEPLLQQKQIDWTGADSTLFDTLAKNSTAVSGFEFGVEPQTNNAQDLPYELHINNLSVKVDGRELGLTDITDPDGQITFPTNGLSIFSNDSVDITGTVTDDLSGVQRVLFRIDRLSSDPHSYWNGYSWQSNSIWLNLSFDTDGNWNVPGVDLSATGDYRMYINVKDNAGNISRVSENPSPVFTVSDDITKPAGEFTFPTNGQSISSNDSVDIMGTVSDDLSGVQRILLRIDRLSSDSNSYWNGNSWQDSSIWLSPSFDSDGNWTVPGVDLSVISSYRMHINVKDHAGNVSRTSENPRPVFGVGNDIKNDTIKPSGVFTYPNNGQPISPNDSVDITGNVSDDLSGVQRILFRIDRLSSDSNSYWNGFSWQDASIWLSPSFDSDGHWTVPGVDLSVISSYRMYINVKDHAGNVSRTSENPSPVFAID